MSKRERDIGRSYMTGSQKRAKKAKTDAERLKQSGSLLKLFKSTEAAPVNPPTDHVVHPEKITASEEENTYRDISASPCDDVQIENLYDEDKETSGKASVGLGLSHLGPDPDKCHEDPEIAAAAAVNICHSVHDISAGVRENSSHQSDVAPVVFPFHPDPAKWTVNDDLRRFLVSNAPSQNIDGGFSESRRTYAAHSSSGETVTQKSVPRFCRKVFFEKQLKNGETYNRSNLIYSPSTGRIFCYPCMLYSKVTSAFTKGYDDWKHAINYIHDHENSDHHRDAMLAMASYSDSKCRIDKQLALEQEREREQWKAVMRRVISVVKFLAERGLPFEGEDNILGSVHNGNFLGLMELVAQYDPFLADYLARHGNKGRGKPSYLSNTIYNELIDMMSMKVRATITQEIKKAKYYSICVDSTPDISHIDQLTFTVRYLLDANILERFVLFLPIRSHTAADLAKTVLTALSELDLPIRDCVGQSYDNASNMSGKYTGLQARIKEVAPLAEYVPCAAHSLNLVGSHAAECCVAATDFFGFVQAFYTFCSASTHRWSRIVPYLSRTPKNLSDTRWSARMDATNTLRTNYTKIRSTLSEIADDTEEKNGTRSEARALVKKLYHFETAVLTVLWDTILIRFSCNSKLLQSRDCTLATCAQVYDSLTSWLNDLRKDFSRFESEAETLVDVVEYKGNRKKSSQCPRDRFRQEVFYTIIDRLSAELQRRKAVYLSLNSRFSVLCEWEDDASANRQKASQLQMAYPDELGEDFPDELVHYTKFFEGKEGKTPLDALRHLESSGLHLAFPNVRNALRIYLTMLTTNAEGERSFSTLKRLKSPLRSSLAQDKLKGLALLTMESELTRSLDFEDVLHEFVNSKSRKRKFLQ